MEMQGSHKSQNNFEKEVQRWSIHTSQFQKLLQSYHNEYSVVLS